MIEHKIGVSPLVKVDRWLNSSWNISNTALVDPPPTKAAMPGPATPARQPVAAQAATPIAKPASTLATFSGPSPAAVKPVVQFSVEDLAAALKEAIVGSESLATSLPPEPNGPQISDVAELKERRPNPKPAFCTVDEVWDSASSKYKIVSSGSTLGADGTDDYVFVARRKISKSGETTAFVDVKSKPLLESLKTTLKGVRGTSLEEEKPTVEEKLLYHYISALSCYEGEAKTPLVQEHLRHLSEYLTRSYSSLKAHVRSLIANREVTFSLLWTLFKPNELVYGTCPGTSKPRCIIFDWGENRQLSDGNEYYHIEGRYLEFDGKSLRESTTAFGIVRFSGIKRIHHLDAFPLSFHLDQNAIRGELDRCGRRFQGLAGVHHKEYKGVAFLKSGKRIKKMFVEGRIMVDAAQFFEVDPNYTKPRFDDSRHFDVYDIEKCLASDRAGESVPESALTGDNGYLVCGPTVLGFSLQTKKWLEFAVADIDDICWNPEPFERLAIPEDAKEMIRSTAVSHARSTSYFDDFVKGKGRSLVMLLHGPPGVGKTLTAEGLSENLRRPLYAMSSADIPTDMKEAELQLSRVFRQAEKWGAILLLDEADVFLRPRSLDHARDALTILFLQSLEYYQGIVILTTNRLKDFDPAMQSRIHLAYRYPDLGKDTRKRLWRDFLGRVESSVTEEEIDVAAEVELNGRQIKNAVSVGDNWARERGSPLTSSFLYPVLDMYRDFQDHFVGHGSVVNLSAYA